MKSRNYKKIQPGHTVEVINDKSLIYKVKGIVQVVGKDTYEILCKLPSSNVKTNRSWVGILKKSECRRIFIRRTEVEIVASKIRGKAWMIFGWPDTALFDEYFPVNKLTDLLEEYCWKSDLKTYDELTKFLSM